jgi:FecR protein
MNRIESHGKSGGGLMGRKLGAGLLGLAAFALGAQGLAPVVLADDAAPAARAVRLSSVDGQVQLSQGKNVIATSAVANTPLFEGTTVTTAEDGRAEIQFEDGSVARLSPNSALTLTALNGSGASGVAEITLDGGLGYFELQGAGLAGQIKIEFSDSVATASGFSVLRVNLDTPPGELAVFSGNAHLERGSAVTVDLHGGESVALNGSDASRYTLNETIEPDSWDSWNSDRDQLLTSEAAAKTGATKDYADSSNPAWSDLDANGNWYNVPGQGNIWSPYEAANGGWDPYGNGAWGYSPGFGYTWISASPWGYLPYQCGMWNWYSSFGWGWAPGIGGCNPWWFGGGYFGPNIGVGYGGYRPPLRPHPPRHPFGGAGLIAVNRRPSPVVGNLPARDRSGVVTIAGHSVVPMHPLSSRPQYDHSASGFVNRTVMANGTVVTNVGGAPRTGQGPAAWPTSSNGAKAGTTAGSKSSTSSSHPAPHPTSSGSSASHMSAPSGGGGGGGSHGGGGGGGGGHH